MGRPKGSRNSSPRVDRKVIVRSLADFPPPSPQPTACRLWQGRVPPHGYGERWDPDRQRMVLAHRWVYETVNGPTELDVLHRCDQKLCYRYEHLFAGTAADNALDMMAKGRGRGQFAPGNDARRLRGV